MQPGPQEQTQQQSRGLLTTLAAPDSVLPGSRATLTSEVGAERQSRRRQPRSNLSDDPDAFLVKAQATHDNNVDYNDQKGRGEGVDGLLQRRALRHGRNRTSKLFGPVEREEEQQ